MKPEEAEEGVGGNGVDVEMSPKAEIKNEELQEESGRVADSPPHPTGEDANGVETGIPPKAEGQGEELPEGDEEGNDMKPEEAEEGVGGNGVDVEMSPKAEIKDEELREGGEEMVESPAGEIEEGAHGNGGDVEMSPKAEIKDSELQESGEAGSPLRPTQEVASDNGREFPDIPLGDDVEEPPLVTRMEQWAQKPKAVARGRPKAKGKAQAKVKATQAKASKQPVRKPTQKQSQGEKAPTKKVGQNGKAPAVVDLVDSEGEGSGRAVAAKAKARKTPAKRGAAVSDSKPKSKEDPKDGARDLVKWAPVTPEGIAHMNLMPVDGRSEFRKRRVRSSR